MRDKKDHATFDLPGFGPAEPLVPEPGPEPKAPPPARMRRATPKQEQLELLDPTDASGLPVWQRDEQLDVTGLPVWSRNQAL